MRKQSSTPQHKLQGRRVARQRGQCVMERLSLRRLDRRHEGQSDVPLVRMDQPHTRHGDAGGLEEILQFRDLIRRGSYCDEQPLGAHAAM